MKVQTKVTVIISVVITVMLIALYFIQTSEKQKIEDILETRRIEKSETFDRTLQLYQNRLEVFDMDYTQWDEMVDFVSTADTTWAEENIDFTLNTFKANAAWVLKPDLSLVYAANNLSLSSINKFPIDKEKILKLFTSGYFCHFFILIDNQLFEIRGAPIQPSSDVNREQEPSGFFFVGKTWSQDYLNEIALQTFSKIFLKNIDSFNEEDGKAEDDNFEVTVTKTLLGWNGKPVINIVSQSDFEMLRTSSEGFNRQIIAFIAFSIFILLIVSYFLLHSVSNPLKIIFKGLEEQNPALLTELAKDKAEFGKLSQLIIEFFSQKEEIIDEIHQRKFAESSLNKSEEQYKKIFENVQDIFLTGFLKLQV
jgi:hypothetical protein